MRGLDAYRGRAFNIAVWLTTIPGAAIDEPLLRKFAADDRATTRDLELITELGGGLGLCKESDDRGITEWRLVANGEHGALVRLGSSDGTLVHFKGERDAERMVRAVGANGDKTHYEGERGAERVVRYAFNALALI